MTVGSQVRTCYASIKNIEAGLSILIHETNENNSKQAFEHALKIVSDVKVDLAEQMTKITNEEPQYKS